jgi:hypothetical protein
MSWIKVPKIELQNRKDQMALLSKNIEDFNDRELHWLFQIEVSKKIPVLYKKKLLSKYSITNKLNDRYLIFTHRPSGFMSQDRVLRLAILLGKYLDRTVVLNSMILSGYHNRLFSSEPVVSNLKHFYDMKKMNSYHKVLNTLDLSLDKIVEMICSDSKHYYEIGDTFDFLKNIDAKYICCRANVLDIPRSICDEDKFRKEIDCGGKSIVVSKDIMQKSKKIINSLGEYYSIHVRRGDILHEDSKVILHKLLDAKEVEYYTNLIDHIDQLKKWIPLGSKIYIATDEEDLTMFDGLKKYYDIYFWKDFNIELSPEENNSYYVLSVEELVMINAYRFISTVSSVIPVYVDYRRNFLENIDSKIYSLSFEIYLDFIKKQHKMFPSTLLPSLKSLEERLIS